MLSDLATATRARRALTPAEAAALVPSGSTVMIGGFMAVGSPHRVLTALAASGVRGLTLAALLATASAAILSNTTLASAADRLVDITAIVDHPALDAVREGATESLKEAGFEEGKNLQIKFQSAQGNVSTAAQIARKFVGDKP
jgi:acyl-CoA hydrolase